MVLSKDASNKIKGIAIFLMVATHVLNLFSINNDWGGLTIPLLNTGLSIETIIGRSADICVYLFAFISGYGLCHSYKDKSYKEIAINTINKIIQFLLCYWLVIFVIYLPFYIVNQGSDFKFIELVKTMFGHHGFFSYGWYVYFYLLVLLTLPLVAKLLNINKWLAVAISYLPFIGAYLLLNRFFSDLSYYDIVCVLLFAYATVCIGYTFNRHNIFNVINNIFKGKRWLIMLVTGLVGIVPYVIVFGYYGKGIIQPFSVIPIIIFLIELLSLNIPKWINKPLDILGHNSMNMWYIHYIFFAPYITCYIYSDKWILFSRVAVVAILLGVIISLLISIPFTYLDNKFIKKVIIQYNESE